jgi:hypothetical protein
MAEGMEIRVLVKRDQERRVRVAEDVSAAAAVVAAGEVAEAGLAGGGVAVGCLGVWL